MTRVLVFEVVDSCGDFAARFDFDSAFESDSFFPAVIEFHLLKAKSDIDNRILSSFFAISLLIFFGSS